MKVYSLIILIVCLILVRKFNDTNSFTANNAPYTNILSTTSRTYETPYIPKDIIMTTKNKNSIPEYIFKQYDVFANGYNVTVYDDEECKTFLKTWYEPSVLKKFETTEKGAHKADLFRYAYLYIKGGCYFDVKTMLIEPLQNIIDHKTPGIFYLVFSINPNTVYNGIICTPPYNPYILRLLNEVLKNPDSFTYLKNTEDAYSILKHEFSKQPLRVGLNHIRNNEHIDKLVIWNEVDMKNDPNACNGETDRYKGCFICVDKHKNSLFRIRDPSYGISWI